MKAAVHKLSAEAIGEALKAHARSLFKALGYRISKVRGLQHPLDRRRHILLSRNVDLVIDVGANVGQYGLAMRGMGYTGRIVSFEPMRGACEELERVAGRDGNWEVCWYGLGDQCESREINIAKNSVSSSILEMLPQHEKSAPRSYKIDAEPIEIRRLDDVFGKVRGKSEHIWLKLDVQGFEDRVLKGAESALRFVEVVQVELSLRPLYDSQWLYIDIDRYLNERGFRLVSVEPGFGDATSGELLQMDGIFARPGVSGPNF